MKAELENKGLLSKRRTGLRRNLKIVADLDCVNCSGSGLNLTHNYQKYEHIMRIDVVVCTCVRIEVLK